jgi:hypothetical protein
MLDMHFCVACLENTCLEQAFKTSMRHSNFATLGGSWAAFGHPRVALSRFGTSRGRSWTALGLLLAALGPVLGRHAKLIKKSMPKLTDLESQKGAQREPKSNPKQTKIKDNIDAKK